MSRCPCTEDKLRAIQLLILVLIVISLDSVGCWMFDVRSESPEAIRRRLQGADLLLFSRLVRFSRGLRLAVRHCLAVHNVKTANYAIRAQVAVQRSGKLVSHCLSKRCGFLKRGVDRVPFFRVHSDTWASHDVCVLGPVDCVWPPI